MELPQIALIHLAAGCITILAGTVALASAKGRRLHRWAGSVFVAVMLCLTLSGLYLSYSREIIFTAFLAILASHLVITGWFAARRKDGTTRRVEVSALLLIMLNTAVCLAAGLHLSIAGNDAPELPSAAEYFIVAGFSGFLSILDFRAMRPAGLDARGRIARHLWRMCFALFIAVGIFSGGNSNILPEFAQHPIILAAPVVAVLAVMVFFLLRVWLGRGPPAA